MRKTGIGKHSIEFYDTIDEMPIVCYQKFNKYLLIDGGVGSDIQDFDTHIEKVMRFMSVKDTESANTELQNMRQNVYMIQQELSPKYLAFCCLVTCLDGKTIGDTDEDIKAVYEALKDVAKRDIDKETADVKKKVDDELRLYFPAMFDNSREKEYYDILKKLTVAFNSELIIRQSRSNSLSYVISIECSPVNTLGFAIVMSFVSSPSVSASFP